MLSSFLESFVENCPAAVAMFDTEMRYLMVSRRWLEDYRLLTPNVVGRCHYEVFPEISEEWKAIHRRCLAGAVERRDCDPFPRADGSVDWVKWEVRPWMAPDGGVGGLLMMTEVVTARVQAEAEMRQSEETFRALFEMSALGMVQSDPVDGRFLKVNRKMTEITGYSQEQLLTMNLEDPVHPDDRKVSAERHCRHLKGECSSYVGEMRFLRPDGQVVWVRVHPTVVRDQQGRAVMSMAAVEDITAERQAQLERREFECQMRQSQKLEAIGQLAGGVAHDFNNILSSILIEAEIAMEDEALSEEAREGLVSILESGNRAANLTRQLLLFSRKQQLESTIVDFNPLVERLLKMLRRMIREDIDLVVGLGHSPAWVEGDPGTLEQIIMNLVVNARDAMPTGGRLEVTVDSLELAEFECRSGEKCPAGTYVRLRVQDTGMGIPPEIQDHIFEPFFTTKAPDRGTGLGLSTVMGIVKQHGGCLTLDSTVGGGTLFTVLLPFAGEVLEVEEPADELTAVGGSETILLVEDEPSVRKVVTSLLGRNGYRVMQAQDAEEAMNLWSRDESKIALLLTDLVMPGEVSGVKLAESLRRKKPGLPIVFMSGYSEELSAQRAVLGVGEKFLAKPFLAGELLSAVRESLDLAGHSRS